MKIEWVISSRIIRPLEGFGLVECSFKGKGNLKSEKVRKSKLFDSFVVVDNF